MHKKTLDQRTDVQRIYCQEIIEAVGERVSDGEMMVR